MSELTPEQKAKLLASFTQQVLSGEVGKKKTDKLPAVDPVTGEVRGDIAEKIRKSAIPATEADMRKPKPSGDPRDGEGVFRVVASNPSKRDPFE